MCNLMIENMMKNSISPEDRFLRLPEVLERLTVSRSSFYAGMKTGIFPAPKKLGARTSVWLDSEITEFIRSFYQSK
ncbi:AlpA family transcriptional regulator [Comamonas sp. 26]|nr:AlpA family transcriptional regulator [Comamonas sp. 26]